MFKKIDGVVGTVDMLKMTGMYLFAGRNKHIFSVGRSVEERRLCTKRRLNRQLPTLLNNTSVYDVETRIGMVRAGVPP